MICLAANQPSSIDYGGQEERKERKNVEGASCSFAHARPEVEVGNV
jgi:hypothetical protein